MATPDARYGYLALRDGRGYVFPLSGRAAARALDIYPAQTLKAQAARRLLALALRLGAGRYILPPVEGMDGALLDHLRAALGRPELVFAISLGVPGPHRKPVLQALTPEGDTVAFIKVGWNAQTRAMVNNEHCALQTLGKHPFQHGRLPAVLHFEDWRNLTLLVTEPLCLPLGHAALTELHIDFLLEVAAIGATRAPFAESDFFIDLNDRLAAIREHIPRYQAVVLDRALTILAAHLGDVELPWFWRLGDFTPWNIGVSGGLITVIDLEYAARNCLPGWDILHFLAQTQFYNGRTTKQSTLIDGYFSSLGIDTGLTPILNLAYALDLWLMWATAWQEASRPLSSSAINAFRKKLMNISLLIERKIKHVSAQADL